MIAIFQKMVTPLPCLESFSVESYSFPYALDHLIPGVDNIRYDVLLSPRLISTAKAFIFQLMLKNADCCEFFGNTTIDHWREERRAFANCFCEVMKLSVRKAAAHHEIQIDYLAQAAVIKLLLTVMDNRFEALIRSFRLYLGKAESQQSLNPKALIRKRQQLDKLIQNRTKVLRDVGQKLFSFLLELPMQESRKLRESAFGCDRFMFAEMIANPILCKNDPFDDVFTIDAYNLILGHYPEDCDRYEVILAQLLSLLGELNDAPDAIISPQDAKETALSPAGLPVDRSASDSNMRLNAILKNTANIDHLFNWYESKLSINRLKKTGVNKAGRETLKRKCRYQKILLDRVFAKFQKKGLIDRIAAYHEMLPVYQRYCPPLAPRVVLHFMITPKTRRVVAARLRRLHKLYATSYSLRPLKHRVLIYERLGKAARKKYLLRFLKRFARFHRDIENSKILREAMDTINLVKNEKKIELSRANNTLYEFISSKEKVSKQTEIKNHVILKADIRGSSKITRQLNVMGLNPASYFSLNFFDPIRDTLAEYGANKEFIEGDAIIISISERIDGKNEEYSTSRICGLANRIISIVKNYNLENKKNHLPTLGVGIGIDFCDSAPTYLLDGKKRLMISPAINIAHRLSGSDKVLRNWIHPNNNPFNLYVYQSVLHDQAPAEPGRQTFFRYNINGIEISTRAFQKICSEIKLTKISPRRSGEKKSIAKLYTGTFPTLDGHFQRLIIREARIAIVSPQNLHIKGISSRRYYEVCTHPGLLAKIEAFV